MDLGNFLFSFNGRISRKPYWCFMIVGIYYFLVIWVITVVFLPRGILIKVKSLRFLYYHCR